MPQGAVPRRYAEAAFELARDKGNLDRWRTDLRMAVGVLSDAGVLAILEDPDTPIADKHAMIDRVFPVEIDPGVQHLLYLLSDRNRIGVLQRVVDEFVEMANRAQGVVVATVTTAVPLDAQRQEQVATQLKRMSGAKRVELRNEVNPNIIGGIIAQIGDELYDGSVRTQLTQLAERFS